MPLDHVSGGGEKVDLDTNFTGRNMEKYQVLWQAILHNFSSFLGGGLSPIHSPGRGQAGVTPIESANVDWRLWRPTRCDPPLCTINELDTIYSIDRLADFHEILDEETEYRRRFKAAAEAKAERDRGK